MRKKKMMAGLDPRELLELALLLIAVGALSGFLAGLFGIGAHGGYAALTTFLPTYLREVRHLSVLGSSAYLAVIIVAFFCGCVVSGIISDRIGRRANVTLFAAAFATHHNWQTFLVGLAASIGAGISMGFAEALSDDGSLTGRGSPWLRGITCGLMTTLGGLGHTIPYLVPDAWPNAFWIATAIAGIVVFFELWAIAFIRSRYMDTPFLQAVFQIVLGGAIVLAVGILIGAA